MTQPWIAFIGLGSLLGVGACGVNKGTHQAALERNRELTRQVATLQDLRTKATMRQLQALVFTQFREATEPLARFLGEVFGRPGLVLHGETPVRARKDLVARFQEDESVPFFVLSVKAGGTGLNLTAASQVVHFDRWWNPAVEDQATDRAYRLGQHRNVDVPDQGQAIRARGSTQRSSAGFPNAVSASSKAEYRPFSVI